MQELASAITLSGQFSIKWADRNFNEILRKMTGVEKDFVLAADTDSAHISFDEVVKKMKPNLTDIEIVNKLDMISEKIIGPEMEKFWNELGAYVNCFEQKMEMKREAIVKTGVYLAKKKYIYHVYDNEGVRYDPPILKVTGVEIVRSSTPEFCREKLKVACKHILEKNHKTLLDYLSVVKTEWNKLGLAEMALPVGVNGLEKYEIKGTDEYKSGTPIHVRASIVYNNYLMKHELDKKYPLIQSGDKIRWCNLTMPNILHENVIGFPISIPKELFNEIKNNVDYELQFDKAFLAPLKRITVAAGMEIENKDTLEDFF